MLTIRVSDLAKFTYCARLPFFDHYCPVKPPLSRRFRMFLGKVYHFMKRIGAEGVKEQLLEAEVNGVRLIGKPDVYAVLGAKVVLEEIKSSRAPRKAYYLMGIAAPVYPHHLVQAMAYAYLLKAKYGKPVEMVISYRDRLHWFKFDGAFEEVLMAIIDRYKMVVEEGILPDVVIDHRCQSCQYLPLCLKIEHEAW